MAQLPWQPSHGRSAAQSPPPLLSHPAHSGLLASRPSRLTTDHGRHLYQSGRVYPHNPACLLQHSWNNRIRSPPGSPPGCNSLPARRASDRSRKRPHPGRRPPPLPSPDAPPLATIRSLAYFSPVIDEVLRLHVGQEYFRYLRYKLDRFTQTSQPPFPNTL